MKILLVTGKWPISNSDIDGGCLTTMNILETLNSKYCVDILLPVAFKNQHIPYVRNTLYFDMDEEDYISNYNNKNKFLRRLIWNQTVIRNIAEIAQNYDRIIIIHCFFAMGLEKILDGQLMSKILVFPMFMTPEYTLSGENVPSQYTEMEQAVLSSGMNILVPSEYSKNNILSSYKNVNPQNIMVFPRYVSECFCQDTIRTRIHHPIRLIYVASIKLQKNNIEILDVAYELFKMNVDFIIYLVGAVQNTEYADQIFAKLETCPFKDSIIYHEPMPQSALAEFYTQVDISLSVASCETFGRAIMEGLYAGVPAIVRDTTECFHCVVGNDSGVIYSKNQKDMAQNIVRFFDEAFYQQQSKAAHRTGMKYSKANLQNHFLEVINGIKY